MPPSPGHGKRDSDIEIDELARDGQSTDVPAVVSGDVNRPDVNRPVPPGAASSSSGAPAPAAPTTASRTSAPVTPPSALAPLATGPVKKHRGGDGAAGGILLGLQQTEESWYFQDQTIAAVEDTLPWLNQLLPGRHELRVAEITKLTGFGCFEPYPYRLVSSEARIYRPLWVDTPNKSRLTLQDKRSFGDAEEIVHCPTPSAQCNNCLEFVATWTKLPMWCWDVISAFPHAPESNDSVFMYPPAEWDASMYKERMVWWMRSSLYGRRSAGANFRDYLESVIISTPDFAMIRGDAEPCCYRSGSTDARLTHHIDDGRIVASEPVGNELIVHLATYLLLKVTTPIYPGQAVKHLGRIKLRTPMGWVTIPDDKHLRNVFERVGFGEDRVPGRSVSTPSVKRLGTTAEDEPIEQVSVFRSAVGSLIYFSMDVEVLTFCVKELARALQKPLLSDWLDLKRTARWLWDHADIVIENSMDCELPLDQPVPLKVQQDSDWGSSRDRRSTTGIRASIAGFRISHCSQTQPGLPALSSGEAELRSLTRACCEGLYLKQVLAELGVESTVTIEGDASAAYRSAEKLGPGKVKHLEVSAYFIKEAVRKRMVKVHKVPRDQNLADMFTHHLSVADFKKVYQATGCKKKSELAEFHILDMTQVNTFETVQLWRTDGEDEKVDIPELLPSKHVDAEIEGFNE